MYAFTVRDETYPNKDVKTFPKAKGEKRDDDEGLAKFSQ